MIPFNRPFIGDKENAFVSQAIASGKIAGDGAFTKRAQNFLENRFRFKKSFLTTSCTDALELAAILCEIVPGDEVIVPSYTFVSTANAFLLHGAKIVFADSESRTPNLDIGHVERLLTPKTKVVVPVHYAGIACDMDRLMALSIKHGFLVVEDAAQAIDSYYRDRALGSLGHFGALSFHETKNIVCGEGGALVINDERYIKRAEIVREKGTNRSAFFRHEIDKYGWVDVGSSFLPSELNAAFLAAQLEQLDTIQSRRKAIWERYSFALKGITDKGLARKPLIPDQATHNGHLFYLVCRDLNERTALIDHLKNNGIQSTFHYQSLSESSFAR